MKLTPNMNKTIALLETGNYLLIVRTITRENGEVITGSSFCITKLGVKYHTRDVTKGSLEALIAAGLVKEVEISEPSKYFSYNDQYQPIVHNWKEYALA